MYTRICELQDMLNLFIVVCPSICLSSCPSNNSNAIYAPMDDERPCH